MHDEKKEELAPPSTVFSVISDSLKKSLPEYLAEDARVHLATVYGCAVAHALRDLGLVSAQGGFDEEDRTASLIGHLGSHLSWYLAMADLSGLKEGQPSVSWSYQSKKAEAEKGGDFGLAVRLSDDKYNIAFFQAKNADFTSETGANLWRPPYGYSPVSKKIPLEQEFTKEQKIRDEESRKADKELTNAIYGQQLSAQSGKGQHQLVKLSILADRAMKKIEADSKWIHYVLWPIDQSMAPKVFDLPTVKRILQGPGAISRSCLNVSAAHCRTAETFTALVMRGVEGGADGWLTVSKEQARSLIGDLTELCNRWMIVEDRQSSGALANALKGQNPEFFEHNPPLDHVPELQLQKTTPTPKTKLTL